MRQRIADLLQVAGGIGLTVAAGLVSLTLGVLVGSVVLIVAGILAAS